MRSALVSVLAFLVATTITAPSPAFLKLTAIATHNGESVLECWQLADPFGSSSAAGTAGVAIQQFGASSSASFLILPPRFNGGQHNAPAVQYVAFTSGLAHITLPCSGDQAWVHGGKYGIILATDVVGTSQGHITVYPSMQETTGIQIPTKDGKVPAHSIVHTGACRQDELNY